MFFPDLAPCSYFPLQDCSKLLAVGWLDSRHDFQRGPVEEAFVNKLFLLLQNPWQPGWWFAGRHECEYCTFSGGPTSFGLADRNETIELGMNNVFIPGEGCAYVAPSLVIHYIDAHQYCPPVAFQEAVMACPEMRSVAYLKAILANGPKGISRMAQGGEVL